ncbi:MAG: N-carbamoylputrescine amidase [Gammaproteobacteria bacterium]|nr:N-carbamoylputrescine amidase [Gammaproteobacteria bacterium]MDH3468167.1 N-carbamoylputrescine amidase [Gammaproteobacteria bacterium]
MSKLVTVAATQMACDWNIESNIDRAEQLVREATAQGGQIILLQELFQTPYFCIEQNPKHLQLATPYEENATIKRFAALAKELKVVLPVSWFERSGNVYFNSVAMIDTDGSILGRYRKTHIPNDIGYQEKQYFSPGDTGFKVWQTEYGKVGLAICWDQWFPEAARCTALLGAEILLYPTAIGSELDSDYDSVSHWQTVMQGHAAANIMPVVASNRIGTEKATQGDDCLVFYGSSFIADHLGQKVQEANRTDQSVITHRFDLDAIENHRHQWCLFRDRRPEHYGPIMTMDGTT